MLIAFLLAVLGFIWFLRRYMQLISVSTQQAVRALNISIPNLPLISIDKVTHTSMVLHWDGPSSNSNDSNTNDNEKDHQPSSGSTTADGPPRLVTQITPSSISHFVLYINGIQSAIIDGSDSSCMLDGLLPDSHYQVDLVAFNMSNFRSKSCPIYVKTAAYEVGESDGSSSLKHPTEILKVLLPEEEQGKAISNIVYKQTTPKSRSRSGTIGEKSNNINTSDDINNLSVHLITDINELKFLLESSVDEVRAIKKSYLEAESEFREEEASLVNSRDEAKKRRKIEDSNRASLQKEIKLLEGQRVTSASKVSRDKEKLASRQKAIQKKITQMDKWKAKVLEMKGKEDTLKVEHPKKIIDLKLQIQEFNKEIFSLQSENHVIEEDIKDALASRKKMDARKQRIATIFEELNAHTDKQTGLLKHGGLEYFAELIALEPEWEDEIKAEVITIDQGAESKWRAIQQQEYARHEQLKQKLEENRRTLSGRQLQFTDDRVNNSYARTYGNNNSSLNLSQVNSNGTSLNPPQAMNMYNNGSINSLLSANLTALQNNSYNSLNDSTFINQMSTSPTTNNVWSLNQARGLTLDTTAASKLNLEDDTEPSISPSANIFLPQDLIEGDDLRLTTTATSTSSAPNPADMLQPPTHPRFQTASSVDNIRGSGLYGSLVNMDTSQQLNPGNSTITSLSALANTLAANPQSAPSGGNIMGSPHSLNIQPHTAEGSNYDNLSLHLTPGQEMEDLKSIKSLTYNKRSLFDTFSNNNNNNSNSPSRHGSPNVKDTNVLKLFSGLSQGYTQSISSTDGNNSLIQDFSQPPDYLASTTRGRSTSFGSSIWTRTSNNPNTSASNTNWNGGLSLLNPVSFNATPISSNLSANQHQTTLSSGTDDINATSPQIFVSNFDSPPVIKTESLTSGAQSSVHTVDELHDQPSSSLFKAGKFFKFGTSPNKTVTKSSDKSSEDLAVESSDDAHSNHNTTNSSSNGTGNGNGSGSGSGLLSGGFGAKSSRFFKRGARRTSSATVHTQASDNSASNENGNSTNASNGIKDGTNGSLSNGSGKDKEDSSTPISKRLSLGISFKRGDKDKDKEKEKNKIIEEKEEPSDVPDDSPNK